MTREQAIDEAVRRALNDNAGVWPRSIRFWGDDPKLISWPRWFIDDIRSHFAQISVGVR